MTDEPQVNILLVDDRPANLIALETVLEKPGRNLIKSTSGNDALARLLEFEFAVVLLDVQMPEMDGFEVAELMRSNEKTRHIPIIFLTAISKEDQHVFRGYESGAVDYIFKPLQPSILESKVGVFITLFQQQKTIERTLKSMLEMKDNLLSHVSHELRSPLTPIHQFVTILLDEIPGEINDEQRQCLEITLRNVKQLQSLIDQLLNATRAGTGKLSVRPRMTRAEETIAEVVASHKPTAATCEVELIVAPLQELPHVAADPVRLNQILTNLVGNALKFTPPQGRITINAELLPDEPDMLRISVTDTGSGLSKEGACQIFERLYQEDASEAKGRKGLGLGLYICKQLVTAHQGRIWVESIKGEGSTFFFTLPTYFLTRILESIIAADGVLRDSIALLTILISLNSESSASEIDDLSLNSMDELLKRCSLPEDFILPGSFGNEQGERFFILSPTSCQQSQILVQRITHQLKRAAFLKDANLGFDLWCTSLPVLKDDGQQSLGKTTQKMAADIEELITSPRAERIREQCKLNNPDN